MTPSLLASTTRSATLNPRSAPAFARVCVRYLALLVVSSRGHLHLRTNIIVLAIVRRIRR